MWRWRALNGPTTSNHNNMPRNLYPVVRLVNFFMLDVDLKCFEREKKNKNKRALIEHQPRNS